jgi:serine/threonine protein kinase/WD40 repeat protein
MTEESLFLAALEKPTPAERQAFLEEACGQDVALRARVQLLLEADARAPGILERRAAPPAGPEGATVDSAPGQQGTVDYGDPTARVSAVLAGKYKLVEEIGEGGMGSVFMAQQTEPVKRAVAVKVVKAGMDSKAVLARFEAERQALAMMDHPNIAKVLDAGTTDGGRPFFVMELVKGTPITRYCDEHKLTPRQRLELFVPVCQAIQHAHQKGVIHRDIKPSNVLVALYDDRPVPKVIDFGVAKAAGQSLTDKTLMTGLGAIVGTAEYMSPEQASLNNLDIDTRSDVYSLGVLLFELLTGTTPVDRKSLGKAAVLEILRIVREFEAPRPSAKLSTIDTLPTVAANRGTEPAKLSRLMKGELDWLVMKALEKDRTRRYDTPGSFAQDIERYLGHEAILARPPSTRYKLRKFVRRNRVAVLTVTVVAVAVLAGAVVATWQAVRASNAERETAAQRDVAFGNEQKALANEAIANQKRQEALTAQEELRETLYAAEMNLVQAAWEADNVPRVRDLLSGQVPRSGQRDLRGFEWFYWDRQSHAEANVLQLPDPFPQMPLPMFDSGGVRLAAVVPHNDVEELQVWDALTGAKRLALALPGGKARRHDYTLSADGERAATIRVTDRAKDAAPFDLRVYDVGTGKERAALTVPGLGPEQGSLLAMSTDGSRVLTVISSTKRSPLDFTSAVNASRLDVWDVATGQALLTVPLGSVRGGPALSPDGTRAAVIVSLDGKGDFRSPHAVKTWDVGSGKELQLFKGSTGEPFTQVVFSPDGTRLAAAGVTPGSEGIWIWDTATGKELRAMGGRRNDSLLCVSPDGKYLASHDPHATAVTVWDTATGRPWSVFKGHASGIQSVAFDPDGRQLRTVTLDGTIRTWTIPVAQKPRGLSFSSIRMARMAISGDGSRIVDLPLLGAESNRMEILALSGKPVRSIPLPAGAIAATIDGLVLNPNGTRLAVRWNVKDSTTQAAHVHVWDTLTGKELYRHVGQGRMLLALSPDGNRLAVPFGASDTGPDGWHRIGGVKVIDLTTGQEVQAIELNPHPYIGTALFSPNGSRLLTASFFTPDTAPPDAAVVTGQIWDVAAGKEVRRLTGISAGYSAAAFHPDGSLLAVSAQLRGVGLGQSVIELLDTATGQKRLTLRGHSDHVLAIAFSPDGRRIASTAPDPASGDSEVRIWDTASGKGLSTVSCRGMVRGLAFRPDGRQLIGVRDVAPDNESGIYVWDATPRGE